MRPFFMQFKQGDRRVAINLNQVCHITPSGVHTVFTFNAIIENEPCWLAVDETYEEVNKRITGALFYA